MSEKEAIQFIKEAQAAANYKSFFGGNKSEQAAELYNQAGNTFKLLKKWKEAGDAFIEQSNLLLKIGEKDEAATAFMNASKAYKKTSALDSITALQQAVTILSEKGRFTAAANNQKQIAEMYESMFNQACHDDLQVDVQDLEKAMQAFDVAGDWYLGEDSKANAHACILKVGTLAAQLEQYDKAIEKFETVAVASVDNNLTKWSVREYLFKAGLCILCIGDFVRAAQSLNRYCNIDVSFSTTREFKLLQDLLGACEEQDVEAFTNSIVEYDRLSKLDSWKTTILLRIKKTMGEEVDFT